MNFSTENLKDFNAGTQARKALDRVFQCVHERLSPDNLSVRDPEYRDDQGPILRVGRKDWKSKLRGGPVERVELAFTLPGILGREEHGFEVGCFIWHKENQANWELVKGKLDRWFKQLKAKRCKWAVWRNNWQTDELGLSADKIGAEPLGICFWEPAEDDSPFTQARWPEGDVEQLVPELVARVKRVVEIVEGLD
jgi:hypothetical protein